MKHQLRSSFSTQGRRMAGARALWTANGMKKEQMGKPIIAIVNSFTQFVPGHVHLHEIGQFVKEEIEKLGCFAAEFNTIAIDDGIAMGHDGMLYSQVRGHPFRFRHRKIHSVQQALRHKQRLYSRSG